VNFPDFDLDGYVSRYSGYNRIQRLRHIARICPDKRPQAFLMAIDLAKKGVDTTLYQDVIAESREFLGDALGDEAVVDQSWVGATNRAAIDKQARLESALSLSKREEDVDPIRRCLEALGKHYLERGDHSQALAKFHEAKQTGFTNNVQRIDNSLDIIEAAIPLGSFAQVKKQYELAKRIPQLSETANALLLAKLNAANGLQLLRENNYSGAARTFMQTTIDLKDKYKEVIAIEDVTDYAVLCALASYTRRDLSRVLENEDFRKLLELRSFWIPIIQAYLGSKYAIVFKRINDMENEFLLDMYMHPHIRKISHKIRDRALIEYAKPFVAVKISHMAKAFDMDGGVVEEYLANLIADGRIEARIDSANKVVYARNADVRSATFQKALSVGTGHVRNVKSLLMRMSLADADIIVRHPEHERRVKEKSKKSDEKGGKG